MKYDFNWVDADYSDYIAIDPDFLEKHENDPFYRFDEKFAGCSTEKKVKDVKFVWNGIKVNGKLHRAHYSNSRLIIDGEFVEGYITIYARDLDVGLPRLEGEEVINRTDSMTDYFEKDRMRIAPQSRYYVMVKAAFEAQEKHNEKKIAKRQGKRSVGHICFSGDFEFFQKNDEVYRAPIKNNPFDIHGHRTACRWECSRAHFDHYRTVIVCN